MPAALQRVLQEECLGQCGGRVERGRAHPDPFLRSMSLWLLGRQRDALATLLDTEAGARRRPPPPPTTPDADVDDTPSVFNFYNYLRTHPLLVRRHLAAAAAAAGGGGGGGGAVLLSGFSHGGDAAGGALTYVDAITPVERRLYFTTAHAHFRAGCPALALEVLTKLPNVVLRHDAVAADDDRDDRDASDGPAASRDAALIDSGTIGGGFGAANRDGGNGGDGGDGGDTANDFDWSRPTATAAPVEKLVFSFDSDEEEEESAKVDAKVDSEKVDALKVDAAKVNGCGVAAAVNTTDMMAQQLKFIACLKLMMQEVSTLATGFEVVGGQLRCQLYAWLEREVHVLATLSNYAHDVGGATAAIGGPDIDGELREKSRHSWRTTGVYSVRFILYTDDAFSFGGNSFSYFL